VAGVHLHRQGQTHIARHVTGTLFEPSSLKSNGIFGRGEQYLPCLVFQSSRPCLSIFQALSFNTFEPSYFRVKRHSMTCSSRCLPGPMQRKCQRLMAAGYTYTDGDLRIEDTKAWPGIFPVLSVPYIFQKGFPPDCQNKGCSGNNL